jgi:hypothetical protein
MTPAQLCLVWLTLPTPLLPATAAALLYAVLPVATDHSLLVGTLAGQVMQRAPRCRSMSQQLLIEVPARPGAPVQSKMILYESRTVQIPIFRCFLSFAVVVKT